MKNTMKISYLPTKNEMPIAEVKDEHFVISRAQDVLDIFGELMATGCNRIIIHERSLHSDFFDLRTRLAGEVLQKFSNYRVKLVIVGNFEKYKSKSLQDFIYESNKSKIVFFTDTKEAAQNWLKT